MRRILLLSIILLLGCSSDGQQKGQWHNANEPEQLSNAQLLSLEAQASKNDAKAAYRLYIYYLSSQTDGRKAIYWLKIAATCGYPIAEYNLGVLLKQSPLIEDQRQGTMWLEKAAKHGVK